MLIDWRASENKSRADLAALAKTSDVTIWRIENNKQRPSWTLAERLERITGIPAAEFMKIRPPSRPSRKKRAA